MISRRLTRTFVAFVLFCSIFLFLTEGNEGNNVGLLRHLSIDSAAQDEAQFFRLTEDAFEHETTPDGPLLGAFLKPPALPVVTDYAGRL